MMSPAVTVDGSASCPSTLVTRSVSVTMPTNSPPCSTRRQPTTSAVISRAISRALAVGDADRIRLDMYFLTGNRGIIRTSHPRLRGAPQARSPGLRSEKLLPLETKESPAVLEQDLLSDLRFEPE